jgi:hypothetical protein
MSDRYWVGGSGNWNATSTTNWATSSGGASGASAPTSADNVIFDGASNTGTDAFTVTVTGTTAAPALCADFSTSALDGAMTFTMGATAFLDVYGSLTLPATNFSVSGTNGSRITFRATTTGKTITTNGVSLSNVYVLLNGVGGGWTLGSALTSTSSFDYTAGALFDTGNFNITAVNFASANNNVRSISLGSSTITLSGGTGALFIAGGINLTFNAGTSTFVFTGPSPFFNGGGYTYYNVSFTNTASGTIYLNAANTFNDLTFTSLAATGIRNIQLNANQTVSGTLTLGAANTTIRRMFVRSGESFVTLVGTPRTITLNGTLATLADVDFRDVVAAGTVGTWTGTRLGDCGGNSGITLDAAKTVYRVGTGSWSATQWSLTSGGSVDVNNFPLAQDTAIFDTGTTTGTHTIDGAWNIGNLDMSALNVAVTLASGSTTPNIHGNLTLDANVTLTGTGDISFAGVSNQTLTSAGKTFTQPLTVNKPTTTSLILSGALTSNLGFTLTQGTLNLNNFDLTCLTLTSNNSNTRSIAFGTGKIDITFTSAFASVITMATVTNFSCTGSKNVRLTGLTATQRNIDFRLGGGGTESNSFNLTVLGGGSLDTPSENTYLNFDLSSFTGTLPAKFTTIYGNLILSSTMTVGSGTSITTFAKSSGTQTITSNGKTLDFPIIKTGAGTLQLQDNLTIGSTRTLTHTAGTLDLNDQTLTTGLYSSTGSTARQLDVGTGTLTVSGATFTASGSNYTTAGTGTISMTSASGKTFAGGGFTYPILNQGGAGALTITGANTFANITNTVQPATVTFPASTTTTVSNFSLLGTAGNLITINSSTSGTQATLYKNTPNSVILDYLNIKDSNATGLSGVLWFGGANSTNSGNNTNWLFISPEEGVASITGTGFLQALGNFIFSANGTINGYADVTGIGYRGQQGNASINANANVTALGNFSFSANGTINGYAYVVGLGNANYSGQGSINANATIIANGRIIGDEWVIVPYGTDVWLRQG